MDTLQTLLKNFQSPAYLNWLRQEFSITGIPRPVLACELNIISGDHSSWVGNLLIKQENTEIPLDFVLKLTPAEAGCAELAFHQLAQGVVEQVAPVIAGGLLLDCNACFLLMPNMQQNHKLLCHAQDTFTGLILSEKEQAQVLKALAEYHTAASTLTDQAEPLGYGRYRSESRPLLESVTRCSALTNGIPENILPSGTTKQLKRLLPHAVHYWNSSVRKRFQSKQGLTICHGDCFPHHFWVHNENNRQHHLFDFDLATLHSPVWDLVTLLSTGNFPDKEHALNIYYQHAHLTCSHRELKEEYQKLCLCQIFHVLAERERGTGELIWKVRLANLLRQVNQHVEYL